MLLLFDVDGTLVGRAAGEHSRALRAALRQVHRVDPDRLGLRVDPAGRTDNEIARLLLLEAGVSAKDIDRHRHDVREVCCQIYAELCPPSLADKVLPGVADLLTWLESEADVRLSLVTGNFEPVARLKLTRAGLGAHFPHGQGAFGSDSEDRTALPHIARKRAGVHGIAHPRADTIVIGDTPRDIICARADEVRCLAVATGPYGVDELSDADGVARGAAELRPLLEAALADSRSGGARA
ncbi:MAG: phosphoglycolate phosphatase [Solirubrobacteraceae bacterium]|nr:phosphoglycolate phosphatase [Solirubrobacteraceae bacterium]